jgi:hypothetical protein
MLFPNSDQGHAQQQVDRGQPSGNGQAQTQAVELRFVDEPANPAVEHRDRGRQHQGPFKPG